jgi:hypothetical protein
MLIRRHGQPWHAPASQSYRDEAALELLLKESPDLLPGAAGAPLGVVSQLHIPETGPADLVAVSSAGTITVVECKLRANPEIRRHVFGQVLAYASGLWRMTYGEFDAAYSKRAGMPLHEHVGAAAEAVSSDFDEVAFRAAVAEALAQGNLSMVIAVDEITDELRRTVEFLNSHTVPSLDVLALALAYVRDGDVEVLVPTLYGGEAVREKTRQTLKQWTEADLLNALAEYCEPPVAEALRRIYEHTKTYPSFGGPNIGVEGGHFFWGRGHYPSVTAWCPVEGKKVAAWSVYTDPAGTVFAINFAWIASHNVSEARLAALADALRPLPGVATLYSDLEARQWGRRPSIPVGRLFAEPGAVEIVIAALDALVGP